MVEKYISLCNSVFTSKCSILDRPDRYNEHHKTLEIDGSNDTKHKLIAEKENNNNNRAGLYI
ncbi:MAG TPA: hypothetical protein VI278_05145 [Nitrososphaeraceae archaeon]